MNASSETWQLGNQAVQISHLEKVYWPQAGFTKGELLGYYRQIAPVLLPYLKDRPVTLRMYPQGVEGTSYYLRDCPAEAPMWLRRVSYRPRTVSHSVPLPLIDTAAGLLWFANQGAIEFQTSCDQHSSLLLRLWKLAAYPAQLHLFDGSIKQTLLCIQAEEL